MYTEIFVGWPATCKVRLEKLITGAPPYPQGSEMGEGVLVKQLELITLLIIFCMFIYLQFSFIVIIKLQ